MTSACRQCGRMECGPDNVALGLCETCGMAIAKEVQGRVRTIYVAIENLRNGADLSTKLEQCDRILCEAEALHAYETQDILTTVPPPSTLLEDFRAKREALERAAHDQGEKSRSRERSIHGSPRRRSEAPGPGLPRY